jgi:hypothetical protein
MRPHRVRKGKLEESDGTKPDHPQLRIAAGFDYATKVRGYWARLRNGKGDEIVITDFPTSLLHMLKAGELAGAAKADAEALSRET